MSKIYSDLAYRRFLNRRASVLKYAYQPEMYAGSTLRPLNPNSVEYVVPAEALSLDTPVLDVKNAVILIMGGYLLNELLGSSVGTSAKGAISRRLGG